MGHDRMSRYTETGLVVRAGHLSHYVAKNDPRFWHKLLRYEPDNLEAMYHVSLATEQEALDYLRQYGRTQNPLHFELYEERLARAIVLMKEALNWGYVKARREYQRMTQTHPIPLKRPDKVQPSPLIAGRGLWWIVGTVALLLLVVLSMASLPIYVLHYYTDRSVTHLLPYEVIDGRPDIATANAEQQIIEVGATIGKVDLVNQLLTSLQSMPGSSLQGKKVIAVNSSQSEIGQAIWKGGNSPIRVYIYPQPGAAARDPKSALLWEPTTVLRSALLQFIAQNGYIPPDLTALTQPFPHNYLTALPLDPVRQVSAVSTQLDGQGGWVYCPDKIELSRPEESIPRSLFPNLLGMEEIPFAPLQIDIDKSNNLLTVSSGQQVIRRYPVAIGREDRTPEGDFAVAKKVMNPDNSIPAPENPYGFRAMELSDGRFAIHGTNDPDSIGMNVSAGCIRLRNDDIQDLYAITPLKTPVKIHQNTGERLASAASNPSPWLTVMDQYPYRVQSNPREEDNTTIYRWGR